MKKRHFHLDHLRLRFLYRVHIQDLEFTSQEINEYSILMEFLGRDLPTNHYDIKTDYKKYSFSDIVEQIIDTEKSLLIWLLVL